MQQQERVLSDGSQVALLYKRYAPTIFAYLYRQTVSREDAEDLLLEIFLAAIERKNFSTLGEKEQMAWLWSVARNKVADHYRRFTRHPSIPLKQVEEMLYANEEQAPEQIALKQEEYTQLYTHLKTLSEAQRAVLQLRFGHGLSCAEIASVMEKSENAIRMLLSRTLKLLRTIYKKP